MRSVAGVYRVVVGVAVVVWVVALCVAVASVVGGEWRCALGWGVGAFGWSAVAMLSLRLARLVAAAAAGGGR